jgi:carboxyl-terminal processing protease
MVLAILFVLNGCKKDDPDVDMNIIANRELQKVMDSYYLWYEEMPSVNYQDYPTPVELLDALTYKALDRWSYISTKQEIDAYYQNAQYIGFGVGLAFDTENNLWITFVFDDSPMKEFGVDRGWRIKAINGTIVTPSNANSLFSLTSSSFTFINPAQQEIVQTFAKREVVMNTVLMDSIYTRNAGKIGYFVLKGFVGPTINELDVIFNKYLAQGITDLIIDLRYNGGGSVLTASHLSNLIAGNIANNQVLGRYVHNDKHTADNQAILIEAKQNSINLNRVVFITTKNSASASELVINGLFPHMEVILVGDDTYGKPVGMYVFTSDSFDWAFVPICFKILNADNEGDYYNGIPVDIPANDGINYPFGDLNEPSLSAAIAFLEGVPSKSEKSVSRKFSYPLKKGLMNEIGAW